MVFAAIYILDFSVQAAIRVEPSLRDSAVALVDGVPPQVKVVAANGRAFQAGTELGMARNVADQFESVQIRPRSHLHEKAAHAALLDFGWSISPRIEDTAPDTIVIDLAGLSSLFGSQENIARRLLQQIVALGLTAHIAIASNIDAAIHAARGFSGITLIPSGEESKHLGSLPVGVLRPSPETLDTLELWGVRTCEALAALPVLQLSERLGQEGVRLHEWAQGAGARSLVLADPATCFEEGIVLEDSVEELEPLSFLLGRLLDQLCMRLTARSLAISIIRLRFSLDPSGREDVQRRGNSNISARLKKKSSVFETAISLPVPIRDSKLLLKLLRLKLQSDPPQAPIQKIFVAAEPAKPRALQADLFLPSSPHAEKVELIIARLANLVGDSNIGSPHLLDTHHPDAFCMDHFTPAGAEPKAPQRKKPLKSNRPYWGVKPEIEKPALGFRMFRPSLPASVHLQEGLPKSVLIRGTHGKVIGASGPWRTSGDWWREDNWHQDEWDLEIRFQLPSDPLEIHSASRPQHGLYRFHFDSLQRKWFVRGIYD